VAVGALVVLPAQSAVATSVSSGATGFASAAFVGTARMNANLTLTGSLGGLLSGLIAPIVSNALNPLVAALQDTASEAVGAALGPTSSYQASTPTTQGGTKPATFPADLPAGLPSPCSTSSTTQPCYNGTPASVNAAPLATVGVTSLSGYTQQTPAAADSTSPIFGRAQTASARVSVLPAVPSIVNPAISTGTVDSMATCPNDGNTSPSAQVSAANVSLLGGKVTLAVADGSIATITANGTTYPGVDSLPTLSFGGLTVQPYGDSIAVTLPLTLSQVLTALGLPGSVSTTLLTYATSGTALNLTFVIGPNVSVTKTSVTAWGIGVGVDLSGSLTFDLLGVVGATVAVPSGISGSTFGNVLDLRLAYSSCHIGSISSGEMKVIPAQLV
jgi:hypothetical protein